MALSTAGGKWDALDCIQTAPPHPPCDLLSEARLQDRSSETLELHSVPSSRRGRLRGQRWLCCQGISGSVSPSPHATSTEVAHGEGCSPFLMAQAGEQKLEPGLMPQ